MNTDKVEALLSENGAFAIIADNTHTRTDIDELLVELGNPGKEIPLYAIYPGDGGDPITLDGLITQQMMLDALQQAGPSRGKQRQEVAETEQAQLLLAR